MSASKNRWYWEEMSMTGGWAPVASYDAPATCVAADGALRIKKTAGIGPRIRTEPIAIHRLFQHLPLGWLQAKYGGEK